MRTFELLIKRFESHSSSIIGELFVNSQFLCYTLELPWLWNARNVSCIPPGNYVGFIRYDKKDCWRIQLNNVPRRSGVQIHIGNYPRDIRGCILIGMTFSFNAVKNSTEAYLRLKTAFHQETDYQNAQVCYDTSQNISPFDSRNIRLEIKGVLSTPWGDYTVPKATVPHGRPASKTLSSVVVAKKGIGQKYIQDPVSVNVDLGTQKHSDASKVKRKDLELQSAHIGPTSALREVLGYSRSKALTVLLPTSVHRKFDKHWQGWAKDQVAKGRTHARMDEFLGVLKDAMDSVDELSGRTAHTMYWMAFHEVYSDLELKPDSAIRLPYSKRKKDSTSVKA